MTGKRLLKSLESDFELVYVAQSCLSWEALHHQYRKVEALAGQNGVFYSNVAGEFQKFQVLLERFMEDQRSDGKRVWSYVRGRFSFKSLLQVPELPGFVEEEKEDEKRGACRVKDVLNAIEKCIQAFWVFVKTDNKKSWWKLRTSLWTCPIVEDPRDLALLAEITRILQKKEMLLKDSQGKERCCLRRGVKPPEETQKKMLHTMVDMKLVSRVLRMSVVSTSQLKWCKEKLDNIVFEEGKVVRAHSAPFLFPS
ncbi:hypothetical protein HS088_TW04G00951 [Tripterygium wilfordii]|uniref:Uncharacterized protein n=2 Tax=Tripterygium wilfordii TaxID=458696 RepID=A0A7J7DRJ5_TRIWF|nr:hypothetical protein HS088_TW04G00951 [Tripterygium wilfordii]